MQVGSITSPFGMLRPDSTMLILDYICPGPMMSLRGFAWLGSAMSVYGLSKPDVLLLVLDFAHPDFSPFLQRFRLLRPIHVALWRYKTWFVHVNLGLFEPRIQPVATNTPTFGIIFPGLRYVEIGIVLICIGSHPFGACNVAPILVPLRFPVVGVWYDAVGQHIANVGFRLTWLAPLSTKLCTAWFPTVDIWLVKAWKLVVVAGPRKSRITSFAAFLRQTWPLSISLWLIAARLLSIHLRLHVYWLQLINPKPHPFRLQHLCLWSHMSWLDLIVARLHRHGLTDADTKPFTVGIPVIDFWHVKVGIFFASPGSRSTRTFPLPVPSSDCTAGLRGAGAGISCKNSFQY